MPKFALHHSTPGMVAYDEWYPLAKNEDGAPMNEFWAQIHAGPLRIGIGGLAPKLWVAGIFVGTVCLVGMYGWTEVENRQAGMIAYNATAGIWEPDD